MIVNALSFYTYCGGKLFWHQADFFIVILLWSCSSSCFLCHLQRALLLLWEPAWMRTEFIQQNIKDKTRRKFWTFSYLCWWRCLYNLQSVCIYFHVKTTEIILFFWYLWLIKGEMTNQIAEESVKTRFFCGKKCLFHLCSLLFFLFPPFISPQRSPLKVNYL